MGYFNFIKFDKLDKIVIAFTFIVVSMFSIFNCFCFAAEETKLVPDVIENLTFGEVSGYKYEFYNYDGVTIYYVPVKEGYSYRISSRASYTKSVGFSDVIPSAGVPVSDILYLDAYSETSIDVPYGSKFLILSVPGLSDLVDIFEIEPVGFKYSINKLYNSVGISQLWSVFNISIPYILIVVVFVFGIYLIVRSIKGFSKGKGRL